MRKPISSDNDNMLELIRGYAFERFEALAMEVVAEMRRLPLEETWKWKHKGLKNLWNQYCWHIVRIKDMKEMDHMLFNVPSHIAYDFSMQLSESEALILHRAICVNVSDSKFRNDPAVATRVGSVVDALAKSHGAQEFEAS